MSSLVLPLALVGLVALSAVTPALTHRLGRDAGWVLAGGFLAVLALLGPVMPGAVAGDAPTWSVPWLPGLGVDLALRLDGLALVFTILVLGVGALVLAYTARYEPEGHPATRLYVLLTLFAAAMLLLVLTADVVVLYVGWELTSVISFLLIGGEGLRGSRPAFRALIVTAAGGLAMLGGVVLLALAAGTTSIPDIVAARDVVAAAPTAGAAAVLLLIAIATKSALLPFSFWLRGAMVAPTPVSTYLHAATMVKAGIYLLALFTPVLALISWWTPVVVVLGLATTVLGGVQALRYHDLKAILAGSTVSQLGFIAAVMGIGTPDALVAGIVHTVAHAAFKASLFMVAGIVDRQVGQRDMRILRGLRRVMPVSAVTAGLAAASMAGVPPLLGFVSKEEVFAAFGDAGPMVLLAAAATTVLTVAYSLRFVSGTFGGAGERQVDEASPAFLSAPVAVAAVGLLLGLAVPLLDPLMAAAARDAVAAPAEAELALWHGLNPALVASLAAIVGGVAVWTRAERVARLLSLSPDQFDGAHRFDRLYDATVRVGAVSGGPFVTRVRSRHLLWLFATAAVGATLAAAGRGDVVAVVGPSPLSDWTVAALLVSASALVVVVRSRLGAMVLLSTVGFLVTVFWVLQGAPDLALTQLSVEALTVVLVVLVFRRLPDRQPAIARARGIATGVVALTAGAAATVVATVLLGPRPRTAIAGYYLDRAEELTGGVNVVNTILVDFRALDTLGEITVLVVAALGVFAVLGRGPAHGTTAPDGADEPETTAARVGTGP